jgi:dihydrodipicolinate synthase/N-acetylneuraminate lyase
VLVQVGCADTPSTVELAKHAEDSGADAVASLTPYYYKPGEKAMLKHYQAVSRSVGLPVFAYNIPRFTGNDLQPALVSEMARSGVISGIKDSSRDFLHLLDLLNVVPERFIVMNGTEEYALSALISGADGLVSGGASALPELFTSLVMAHRRGDAAAALSAQKTIQAVKELVKASPISAYYEILRERGVDCGRPRPPMLTMETADIAHTIKELKKLRVI